jgi:lysozyme
MQINKKLAAIVGAGAASVLFGLTTSFEGTVLKTYRDPVGILTYCTGETEGAVWGQTYTPAECHEKLDASLAKAATGVMGCVNVQLTTGQTIAFVDAAYNIGNKAFCSSSMARRINRHDAGGACDALLMWDKADGRVLPGLVKRRSIERDYCLGKMDARLPK